MPLSALILSNDFQEVSVFECVLGALRIAVEIEADTSLAWIRLKKSKVDAVLVDCDLKGAGTFLRKLQSAATGQGSSPVIILCGSEEHSLLEARGAEFALKKPVAVEQAVQIFSAARNFMLQGRLHYHRHTVETPVSITHTKEQINAQLLNLSQGGMRVRLQQPRALRGDVGVHFLLPGTELSLEARGEVTWADQQGNAGIRLLQLSEPTKRDLRLWLERQYFQTAGE